MLVGYSRSSGLRSWPQMLRIQQSGATFTHGKLKAAAQKLLAGFISDSESIKQGGDLVDQVWFIVGECHPKLRGKVSRYCPGMNNIHSAGVKSRLTDFPR